MLQRRYPHTAVGRAAAPVFAVGGFVLGTLAAVAAGIGAPWATGFLCAAIAGAIAFLVFASEGPQRPSSAGQAAAADGVVTGILSGAVGALIEVLYAERAGAGRTGFGVQSLGIVVLAALLGGLAGGILGLAAFRLSPRRLERSPVQATRTGKRKRPADRRRRRK